MNQILSSMALAAALATASGAQAGFVTFSGIDPNGATDVQVTPTNSQAAENQFKAGLVGVGTENFEAKQPQTPAPLALDFVGAGTATLTGNDSVQTNPPSGTNTGRYSVPGGTRYWQAVARPTGATGNFSIVFSANVAAFGFFGVDVGDFFGTVQLQLLDDADKQVALLNVPTATPTLADASILYFGLIADVGSEFRRINFLISAPGSSNAFDVFGFDSMTIGSRDQIITVSVPEPGTLGLLGLALAGLGFATRRRR